MFYIILGMVLQALHGVDRDVCIYAIVHMHWKVALCALAKGSLLTSTALYLQKSAFRE